MSRNTDFESAGNRSVKAGGQSRLLVIGGIAGVLLGGGGLAGMYFGNNGPVTSARPLLAQMGGGPGSYPGASMAGGPGAGRTGSGAGAAPRQGNSFDGAPEVYKLLQGGGGGAAGAGQMTAGGAGAAGGGAADFSKLSPIKRGAKAPGYRTDPFVSYRIQPYQKPPAYSFIAPLRLASYPAPPKPKANPNPDIAYGPLPYVPRRVSGVLFNGAVSAILETGGLGGDTQVVVPGSSVASGIPGVGNLTVSSITATQLTLRAADGRSVSVDLSASPTDVPRSGGGGGGFGSGSGSSGGSDPRGGGRGGRPGLSGPGGAGGAGLE